MPSVCCALYEYECSLGTLGGQHSGIHVPLHFGKGSPILLLAICIFVLGGTDPILGWFKGGKPAIFVMPQKKAPPFVIRLILVQVENRLNPQSAQQSKIRNLMES